MFIVEVFDKVIVASGDTCTKARAQPINPVVSLKVPIRNTRTK